MSDDLFDISELIDDFVEDARDHLARLDEVLLRLEGTVDAGAPERSLLDPVFGPLHTLKGNAGMMGFAHIQQAVHELETLLKRLTGGEAQVTRQGVDALFQIGRLLRAAVEQLAVERSEVETFAQLDELLHLAAGGELETGLPSFIEERAPKHVATATGMDDLGVAGESQTIKIDFKRLDKLLNLVGELVMYRTALSQLQTDLVARFADTAAARELGDVSQLMGKTITELQEAIMEARLLPMRHVLHPFPRLVRDIARQSGKQVSLHLRGVETELDKTVIDKIGEPLLHLVRNAVGHGIEPPEQRLREGKPETGNLTISASQESNNIVITVEDDGRGLDAKTILAKARANGLVEADRKLTDHEIYELIFAKGFSTASEVTEISGRGVGMDVVREVISSLGGLIEIDTIAGMGTKFTIKLPLTLAIISALLVQVEDEVYAVPITHVLESIRLDRALVHEVNHRRVIRLRDRVMPLLDLRAMFGLPADDTVNPYVVVLGRGERRVGLVVDRLLGQLEIVIKGLDDVVGATRHIAGASVLGDGRVVLIVDVAQLLGGAEVVGV